MDRQRCARTDGRETAIAAAAPGGRAFTLVEMLVVIAVIGVLAALLMVAVVNARASFRRIACLNNLHDIGLAINSYSNRSYGRIPFGPKAPPMMTAMDFYPSTGAPTSLVSLMDGTPVGLGLLLKNELGGQAGVFFCPDSDQKPTDAESDLGLVGVGQAQSSYYYRHASVARKYDPPGMDVLHPDHIELDNLGPNRNGLPIRALVMDTQFVVSPDFAQFGITPRTHHQMDLTNVLFSDGHAESLSNADGRFTVNLDDYQSLTNAFDRILGAIEKADGPH
ncbi:MAG: type II secretion system protein [Thermoguttaceae bacterium]|jgi:prepilin-type N-terminal cleavage/methylation domain-containing protein/prepilin-type processing-associated H-X9-DG protein